MEWINKNLYQLILGKVAMWMEALPMMAAEVAAPMTQCENIKMVCVGDGPVSMHSSSTEQSWALSVFFHFFNNKK